MTPRNAATCDAPMPAMIIRQIKGPSWRIRLVKSVWHMRAEIYALDDGGHVATINAAGQVRPLSKRSKLHGAVRVVLDDLERCHAATVHVLAYSDHADEPFIVRLPIEDVVGLAAVGS